MSGFDPSESTQPVPDTNSHLIPVVWVVALGLAILCCLIAGGAGGAAAEPPARERLKQAEARVERLSEDLTGTRRQFDLLDRRARSARLAEQAIEGRLARGEARLRRIDGRLEAARTAARLAARRLGVARERLAARLVAIYESGTSDAMAIILSTRDFGELAAAGSYLEAIAESERDLARRVSDLRRQRVDALGVVRRSRDSIAAEIGGLRSAKASIAGARAATERSASRLSALQTAREEKIGQLRSDVEEIEAELASGAGGTNFAGGPYAIPTYIVMCESGGNYSALNPSSGAGGAYQIIPSTWRAYGGKGLPHLASKAEQDRIARLIWENDGPGAWVCA